MKYYVSYVNNKYVVEDAEGNIVYSSYYQSNAIAVCNEYNNK